MGEVVEIHIPGVMSSIPDSESLDNEGLADQIQQEWLFRLKRLPEKIVIRYGIVLITLAFLELLLIISNNVRYLGYWEGFTKMSTYYREALTHTKLGRVARLD